MQNQAQGELRRKLPVPFAAHDVVIEDAAVAANRPQALEQISILDLQRLDGTERKRAGCRVLPRKKRIVERCRRVGRRHEVCAVPPVIAGPSSYFRQNAGLDGSSAAVFVVVQVRLGLAGKTQKTKILGPQPLP